MRAERSDPEDDTPNAAKTARMIHGHRAFGLLRWCIRRHDDWSSSVRVSGPEPS
jgi:hypothetical protein